MISATANAAATGFWTSLSVMPRFAANRATIDVGAISQGVVTRTTSATGHDFSLTDAWIVNYS